MTSRFVRGILLATAFTTSVVVGYMVAILVAGALR